MTQLMEPMEEEIVLTAEGLRVIEQELDRLVTVDRHEVAERIRDAKDYGELTENAEYESAKNAQAFIEGRILELKRIVAGARILGVDEIRTDAVGLGSKVTVRGGSGQGPHLRCITDRQGLDGAFGRRHGPGCRTRRRIDTGYRQDREIARSG